MTSIIPWDDVNTLLDGLDDLLDKIEEVEKWREFSERIDRARNGQIGDPVELMAILVDLLEYLSGKVPLGSLGNLIKKLLEVAFKALEAGAAFVRWVLLFRYRRRRAAGQSPREASKGVTNDRAAQVWLRLKEIQDKEGENDEEVEDDPAAKIEDAITTPSFPEKPRKPWSGEHDECCSGNDNGKTPPTIQETKNSSSIRLHKPTEEYEVMVEFEFSHPCGIHSYSVKAYTRKWPDVSEPDFNWIEVPRSSTGSHSTEKQFELTMQETPNGKKGKAIVKSAGDMMLVYHVVSNCKTRGTRYARVIS